MEGADTTVSIVGNKYRMMSLYRNYKQNSLVQQLQDGKTKYKVVDTIAKHN